MTASAPTGTPAIAVEGLWQVFGNDAETRLKDAQGRTSSAPDAADALREEGLIPAVQDASFEVKEGELVALRRVFAFAGLKSELLVEGDGLLEVGDADAGVEKFNQG